MKRTLNWTGRISIPLENISIRLSESKIPGFSPSFSAELSGLENLKLKSSARIYIEPYVGTSSMRFDYGTVANIHTPANTELTDIDTGASILFRIKVVDESGEVGKILAAVNSVRPLNEDENDDRKALLPVAYKDLGERIWEIDINGTAKPQLVLNNRIPALADQIRNDPVFQGAIMPHVVSSVLNHVFTNDEVSDSEWVDQWKLFAAELLGEEIDDEADDEDGYYEGLIKEIVEKFSLRTGWVKKYKYKQDNISGAIND